jgi:hypothetical protein
MNPDLVCKIDVRTSKEDTWTGTGYPIRPNRIITAAHVIADAAPNDEHAAKGDARQIQLSFPHQKETVDGPVFLEWSGTDHGVDVAVLRCELPAHLQPAHRLLIQPPHMPIEWFAQGYTRYGRATQQNEKDNYQGTLTKWSIEDSTVPLASQDGPINPENWKGGSGSVAFDKDTAGIALAVITKYQGGTKLDRLVAVPICYLLNDDSIKDAFRQAIDFETYQKREEYCRKVIDIVASELKALGTELKPIAQSIFTLLEDGASGINIDDISNDKLAEQTAVCIVERVHITDDVVGLLVRRMQGMNLTYSRKVARIVDHLLPLNYAPHTSELLRDQVEQKKLGLVGVSSVATLTIAEIIMAGFDQKPAMFVTLDAGDERIRGRAALVPPVGPEDGLSDLDSDIVIKQEVKNFLLDLIASKDAALSGLAQLQSHRTDEVRHGDDLDREITGYANKLRGSLRAVRKHYQERTIYCVLKLPEEPRQRAFREKILHRVQQHVPSLVFVEQVPWDQAGDREFEIEQQVELRVRLIHTHQAD